MVPERFAPLRSAFERSAPVRSARVPPSLPLKKRSWASRISTSDFPLCLIFFGFLSPILRPSSKITHYSLLDVGVARNTARSARWRDRGSSLRRSGLRPQRIDHRLCDVFFSPDIILKGLNGINPAPPDAPPTRDPRHPRERESLYPG